MPLELLIAIVCFGVIPMGTMIIAAIMAYWWPPQKDPYTDSANWGSQDVDGRKE